MSKKNIRDLIIAGIDGQTLIEITPEDMGFLGREQVTAIINQGLKVQLETIKANRKSTQPSEDTATTDDNNPTLEEAINHYYEFKKRNSSTFEASSKQKAIFRRLVEVLGKDRKVSTLKACDGDNVIDTLRKLPSRSEAYRGKTVTEILSLSPFDKTFTPKNINDHLIEYRAMLKALERHDINVSIFDGLQVKDKNKNKTPIAFNRDELKTVFSDPVFTEGRYEYTYQFWAPLIGLLTGSRLNTIAQLRTYDFKEENGILVIDFNEDTSEEDSGKKKTKNDSSIRKVPIHSLLIEKGLLEYVKQCKGPLIFPDVGKWSDKDGYGRNVGEKFNALCKRIGIINKTFKTFRATITSELAINGVSEHDRYLLVGRHKSFMSVEEMHYMATREMPRLKGLIEKADYADTLSKVKPWTSKSHQTQK